MNICITFPGLPACKQKEEEQYRPHETKNSKKPRLVFTDIQRRTLHAIFKETKRPSKEMQATIAQQLGLEVATVANFFMNARRRSLDKWKEECQRKRGSNASGTAAEESMSSVNSPVSSTAGSDCPDTSTKNGIDNNSFFFPNNSLFDGMNSHLADSLLSGQLPTTSMTHNQNETLNSFSALNPYSMINPRLQAYQKGYSNSGSSDPPGGFHGSPKKPQQSDRACMNYRNHCQNPPFSQNGYYPSPFVSNVDYMLQHHGNTSQTTDDLICSDFYMSRSRDLVNNFLSIESNSEKSIHALNKYDSNLKDVIDFSNGDDNNNEPAVPLTSLSSSPNSDHNEFTNKQKSCSNIHNQCGPISAAAATINAN